jgi:hypothetical protein
VREVPSFFLPLWRIASTMFRSAGLGRIYGAENEIPDSSRTGRRRGLRGRSAVSAGVYLSGRHYAASHRKRLRGHRTAYLESLAAHNEPIPPPIAEELVEVAI